MTRRRVILALWIRRETRPKAEIGFLWGKNEKIYGANI